MIDPDNPVICCTQKELARDAWITAGGAPGEFDRFWHRAVVHSQSLRTLISYVWMHAAASTADGVDQADRVDFVDRQFVAFATYWKKIVEDAKPLSGTP